MRVALYGYPQSGRTTLLQALAGHERLSQVVTVGVPDDRLERLCADVGAKKCTPVGVEFSDDTPPMTPDGGKSGPTVADALRRADAVAVVVREFTDPRVPWHAETDAERDYDAIQTEFLIHDLQLIERRLERLEKEHAARQPGTPEYLQKRVFAFLAEKVSEGAPIRALAISDEENAVLRDFQFLSAKPLAVVVNCDEGDWADRGWEERVRAFGIPVVRLCATIERDLALMDETERQEFLSALDIERSARDALIRAVFEMFKLITFFTAGEKETKAWPLRSGSTVLKAADTIHSDIAKGFIRAEVIAWEDFDRLGSLEACRQGGKMRLEGKEYVVQDGDVVNVRHKS
ncbi:MAG: redox-regulated ATPase YchF [Armatimonadota bacterium]